MIPTIPYIEAKFDEFNKLILIDFTLRLQIFFCRFEKNFSKKKGIVVEIFLYLRYNRKEEWLMRKKR